MTWLRAHATDLILALVGVLVIVAIGNATIQGANSQRLLDISDDLNTAAVERSKLAEGIEELSGGIQRSKQSIEVRLDDLRRDINAQALDIPGILFGQGLVRKEDVFTAAVIDGDLWVIPNDATLARYLSEGAEVETITNLVSGIRVAPIGEP